MRSGQLLSASALTAALLVVAAAGAQQPPAQTQRILPDPPLTRPISLEEIVERFMAFDKNKDGKLTRDELPERLHPLLERGDTNKDGAMDRDEIRKLVSAAPAGFGGGGRGGGFGFRAGPGPNANFGPAGPGLNRVGPGVNLIDEVVDDLKLSGNKQGQARAITKAYQEKVRKFLDQARTDMLAKMKGILSAEEFEDFMAALDRPRGSQIIVGPAPPRVEKR
jgi:hypothetical protein